MDIVQNSTGAAKLPKMKLCCRIYNIQSDSLNNTVANVRVGPEDSSKCLKGNIEMYSLPSLNIDVHLVMHFSNQFSHKFQESEIYLFARFQLHFQRHKYTNFLVVTA